MTVAHVNDTSPALEQISAWLESATRVVVLTGAGISTASGIPDFRGPQGLWTRDPDAEKLSDIRYYVSDPVIRRKAWRARRDSPVWQASPRAGHYALARFEQSGRLHTLVAQNIDGLHQLAGSADERVIEIYGTLRQVACLQCRYQVAMAVVLKRLADGEEDPDCPDCGGILKSATISFGQSLVAKDLARAEQAAHECDLLLAVGSTLSVFPIAGLVPIARKAGARVVIINAEPTAMDDLGDAVLTGDIELLLPQLIVQSES
jgi:NAD-dependent deacetylase